MMRVNLVSYFYVLKWSFECIFDTPGAIRRPQNTNHIRCCIIPFTWTRKRRLVLCNHKITIRNWSRDRVDLTIRALFPGYYLTTRWDITENSCISKFNEMHNASAKFLQMHHYVSKEEPIKWHCATPSRNMSRDCVDRSIGVEFKGLCLTLFCVVMRSPISLCNFTIVFLIEVTNARARKLRQRQRIETMERRN